MNLKTKYLGIELDNPIMIASSPFTMSLDRIKKLEQAGAGAVVLKSVFEEQISNEAAFLDRYSDYPEAADYLNTYVEKGYLDSHLKLIADAKQQTAIPVVASINCQGHDTWADYAAQIEQAGADALELNIFLLPVDTRHRSAGIEAAYLETVTSVVNRVGIPVSVKLGMRFTNILEICRELSNRQAKGVVMFNRFFEPDIDIEAMQLVPADSLSENSELRNVLRVVGLCSPLVSNLDIAVTSGVHSGGDVVKSILAGADAVQICTALYIDGLPVIGQMKEFLSGWMEKRGFCSIEEFRGLMSNRASNTDVELYERVQYMKFMPRE